MALAGVRVLDFTRFQNGPFATCMFADVGADVIKVEQPGIGDTGRGYLTGGGGGFCGYNESLNRGKRSVELDLKSPTARPAVEQLIRWADVLVENYKVGVLDRLGYGYEACREINPKLIYCCNSGFGPKGPWALRGSFDKICQGMSGATVALGGGPSHKPVIMPWGAADQVGALNFAFHIMAALFHRERTGVGQKLECSQLGAMIQFQSVEAVPAWFTGSQRDDGMPVGHNDIMMTHYKCSDGMWINVATAMEERHWRNFATTMELQDMLTDERTKNQGRRWQNNAYFVERVQARFQEHPRQHWLDKLVAADVPVGIVLDYKDIRTDEQARANGYVCDVENQYGRFTTTGVPALYSASPTPPVGIAPDLGEHTEEVLRDVCGLSAAEVASLAAAHATTPDPASGYKQPYWMGVHKKRASRSPKSRL